ncbi:hypothetical protein ACHAWF_012948 [Thalassiosira exigua]
MTPAEKKLHPVTPIITPKAFVEAFKVVDEMTSSSPSGLHYTLWKAIAEDEKFCKYMAVMMSLPFQYGFTNKRWERAIDVMLEKKSGERKIHLMRIIGLVEADFNTALKILFTQRLMANSELAGLSSNQWGGRANRSAPDCATRKLISWENARYMKTTAASFFGDLASCFDRMPTSISTLLSRKKKMDKNTCLCKSKAVRGMTRQIRTAYGTSKITYSETPDSYRLGGEIQGKVNDSYVDDTDVYAQPGIPEKLIPRVDPNEDLEDFDSDSDDGITIDPGRLTVQNLERNAQEFTDGMQLIGQHMAFHKCSYQVLTWVDERG